MLKTNTLMRALFGFWVLVCLVGLLSLGSLVPQIGGLAFIVALGYIVFGVTSVVLAIQKRPNAILLIVMGGLSIMGIIDCIALSFAEMGVLYLLVTHPNQFFTLGAMFALTAFACFWKNPIFARDSTVEPEDQDVVDTLTGTTATEQFPILTGEIRR